MDPIKKQNKAVFKKYHDNRGIVQGDSGRRKLADQVFSLNINIVEDNSNNLIVVSSIINTFLVERILIDDGSAMELLMWKDFQEMGLDKS